jgi:queuine/archaeosine tRNA-ribosyltransferase
MRFMEQMRASILDGTFESFRARVHELYPEDTSPKPVASYGRKKEELGD